MDSPGNELDKLDERRIKKLFEGLQESMSNLRNLDLDGKCVLG